MGAVIVDDVWEVPSSLLPPNDWPAIEARLDWRARLEGYDSWAAFLTAMGDDPTAAKGRAYLRIVAA